MWRKAIAWVSLVFSVIGLVLDVVFTALVWAQPGMAASQAPLWAKVLVTLIFLVFLVSGPVANILTALFGQPIISQRRDTGVVADTFT